MNACYKLSNEHFFVNLLSCGCFKVEILFKCALVLVMTWCCQTTSHSLRWRHNERDSVSNHQPHGCLLNGLLRRRSKKTSNPRVTGLCVGNSPGPVNSPHKGPDTRKCFHLMTSSCYPGLWWPRFLSAYRILGYNEFIIIVTQGRCQSPWWVWSLCNLEIICKPAPCSLCKC